MIVGFLSASGGVGKSAVSATAAIREGALRTSREMRPLAFLDADFTSPRSSSLLMGRFPSELMTFEDFLLGYGRSVFYPPNPKLFESRTEGAGELRLMVCPSACKHVGRISRMPVEELVLRLRDLYSMALEAAERVYVDFPPGNPVTANLATALALTMDAYVMVLKPSSTLIRAAHSTHLTIQSLPNSPKLLAVVLNMWREDTAIDEDSSMRWEDLVRRYFGVDPFIIPFDQEWERGMQREAIPLLWYFYDTPANEAVVRLADYIFEARVPHREVEAPLELVARLREALLAGVREREVTERDLEKALRECGVKEDEIGEFLSSLGEEVEASQIIKRFGPGVAASLLLKLGFSEEEVKKVLSKHSSLLAH